VIREAHEEVNIRVEPRGLDLAHLMYRKHTQPDGYVFYQQDLFFKTSNYSGIVRNLEPHKADDVRFFNINHLPETLSPFIKQAVESIVSAIPYSEFGF
jgi:8-oxo-dGTP diphosphatase